MRSWVLFSDSRQNVFLRVDQAPIIYYQNSPNNLVTTHVIGTTESFWTPAHLLSSNVIGLVSRVNLVGFVWIKKQRMLRLFYVNTRAMANSHYLVVFRVRWYFGVDINSDISWRQEGRVDRRTLTRYLPAVFNYIDFDRQLQNIDESTLELAHECASECARTSRLGILFSKSACNV